MEMQELVIHHREGTGKQVAKRLRRAGVVPAVLYGSVASEAISVDPRAVLRIIHGHEGSTQLVSLKPPEGASAQRMAVIRDLQFDPVTEQLLHVDLQEVAADRPITVVVAIHTVGDAAGVREQKGILSLILHEIEVSCLPSLIPDGVDADVSALMIGDVLTVRNLQVPEGVHVANDPDQAVAIISPPMAEEAPAVAPAAVVAAEPEVLTERKPKEEATADEGKKGRK
jgi:large subunit ribosomal protein L25